MIARDKFVKDMYETIGIDFEIVNVGDEYRDICNTLFNANQL